MRKFKVKGQSIQKIESGNRQIDGQTNTTDCITGPSDEIGINVGLLD